MHTLRPSLINHTASAEQTETRTSGLLPLVIGERKAEHASRDVILPVKEKVESSMQGMMTLNRYHTSNDVIIPVKERLESSIQETMTLSRWYCTRDVT